MWLDTNGAASGRFLADNFVPWATKPKNEVLYGRVFVGPQIKKSTFQMPTVAQKGTFSTPVRPMATRF